MTEQAIGKTHGSRVTRQAQARRLAAAARARRAHERALAAQERARALREGLQEGRTPGAAASGSADVQRAADRAQQATIDLDAARASSAGAHRGAAALHDEAPVHADQAAAGGAWTPDVTARLHAQRSREHVALAEHDEQLARS